MELGSVDLVKNLLVLGKTYEEISIVYTLRLNEVLLSAMSGAMSDNMT